MYNVYKYILNGCGPSLSSPEHEMGSGNILKIEYKKNNGDFTKNGRPQLQRDLTL